MLKVWYQLRRILKMRLSFAKRRLVKPALQKNNLMNTHTSSKGLNSGFTHRYE